MRAARAARLFIPHSTNQIIVFWRRRCRCRRPCLRSLMKTFPVVVPRVLLLSKKQRCTLKRATASQLFCFIQNVDSLDEGDSTEHSGVKLIPTMLAGSDNVFSFRLPNCHEVREAIGKMDPRKSTGYDCLQSKLFKLLAEELAPFFTTIFNQSIQQTRWKRGGWLQVFKNENRLELRNYRPITMLPVFGKIYEQLLSKQITEHKDPIFSCALKAYRKSNGCESTLNHRDCRQLEKRLGL